LIKPELTQDEQSRISTLRSLGILDSDAEERFDRLTRMAARIFDVPIALVSLVDEDRQWFKSAFGLESKQTPRDISFCGHAIHRQDTFIVPDTSKDQRFFDNPLVTDNPNIRFYAGCPIQSPDGSSMGTLCIIDDKPRDLSQDDIANLQDLAAMAERELAAVQMATTDDLTQISNRRGFMMLAEKILHVCDRKNTAASLIFFDLNNFKQVNDQFGHSEGDNALIAFSELMKINFRKSDLFARLGGDEFVVLLTGTTGADAKTALAKFSRALEKLNEEAGSGYTLQYSAGIVDVAKGSGHSIHHLLNMADSLMYENKKRTKTH